MPDADTQPLSLLDESRQFHILVNGVTDYAIYLLDPDGHIASWNPGGERIKGYRTHEVVGRHFSSFYTPEDVSTGEPARALQTAVREGRYEKEGWRVRKDGSRFWASVVIDPIFEAGNLIGFAKVTRDITERRNAQHALEEAQKAFMQSQKAEAISQLTYGLAHDFNNLLTVIVNSLYRIVSTSQGNEKVMQSAATAQRAADRGALLTRQLLAFSRGELTRPRPHDLNALISASEALLRRACDASIAIAFDLKPGLPDVAIDASQFEAAVLNLVVNARDALPDGGEIRVVTRLLTDDGGAQRVSFCVRDNGTGMPPEVAAKALDPFFTTKEVGKGSGLGLSQVYGVATGAGGTVRIESRPGHGTSVLLELPAVANAASEDEARPVKILMVDDDDAILESVSEALSDAGFDVLRAGNARDALETLNNDAGIDVLFSDVVMPGSMSGVELAKAARQLRPAMKVLLASGYAESWLEELPASIEFIPKPYRITEILHRLPKPGTAH